ncbi:hypothetical protein ACLB1S_02450 [Escherichia coli]
MFSWIQIFTIQRRQHVDHAGQVERTFEVNQESTQQAQCFGIIDTDAERERPVMSRTGFLNNDAMFVEVFRHDAGRNTESRSWCRLFPSPESPGDL